MENVYGTHLLLQSSAFGLTVPRGASAARTGQAPFPLRLQTHEGGPHRGHTIARHVGKSKFELKVRATSQGYAVTSTFSNQKVAQKALVNAVRTNNQQIKNVASSGRSQRFAIRHRSPNKLGTVYTKRSNSFRESNDAVFIIRYSSFSGSFRVVTGYVE